MPKFLITAGVLITFLTSCSADWVYHFQEGPVYGSTFHIVYEYGENKSLEKDILAILDRINHSLSIYDPNSLISRINRNDTTARLDVDLERVLLTGLEISEKSGGAFDLTVGPLVNAWGFGFTAREKVTPGMIDSILQFTGYHKIAIVDGKIRKQDPRIMIDPNALAPGYAADVIGEFFESKGIKNYLVEIGGELRCMGVNREGNPWRVGVDKPLENTLEREIEQVLNLSGLSVATSGNYRKFYEEDGVKYSHTIDPKTGYPARSNLLSATIVTRESMYADAWATVCMVIGLERSKELMGKVPGLEGLFIYGAEDGGFKEWRTPGMNKLIQDSSQEQEQPNPQSREAE
jgi:thiamine biosynthesis lipoprotein